MKKRTEEEAGALLADIPEKAVKKKSVASKPARQLSAAGKGGYAKGLATGILLLVILVSAALAGMYFNIGGLATQTL